MVAPGTKSKFFVSYCRADREILAEFRGWLTRFEDAAEFWIDDREIEASEESGETDYIHKLDICPNCGKPMGKLRNSAGKGPSWNFPWPPPARG